MVGGGTCTPLTYGIKLDGCSPRLYHERGNLLKMCLVTGKMRERERQTEKMGKLMPQWVGEKENGVPLICFYYPFCYLLDDNNEAAKKKIISYDKHLSFQPITSKPFKKCDHIKNFEKIISLYDLKINLETNIYL